MMPGGWWLVVGFFPEANRARNGRGQRRCHRCQNGRDAVLRACVLWAGALIPPCAPPSRCHPSWPILRLKFPPAAKHYAAPGRAACPCGCRPSQRALTNHRPSTTVTHPCSLAVRRGSAPRPVAATGGELGGSGWGSAPSLPPGLHSAPIAVSAATAIVDRQSQLQLGRHLAHQKRRHLSRLERRPRTSTPSMEQCGSRLHPDGPRP